jgi:hypothetical protein
MREKNVQMLFITSKQGNPLSLIVNYDLNMHFSTMD